VITVDAQTGDPLSAGASKAPRLGPYVSQEEAIESAERYVRRTFLSDRAWLDKAKVEAYLRGDILVVLFWEEGSKENRIRVLVDAVTGVADGASRG